MTVTQRRISLAVPLAAALLLADQASAQVEEVGRFARTIKPYAQIAYTYDSNLIRLPGEEEALILLGDEALSDTFATYEFGIDATWERGVNTFELSGKGYSNVYNRFSGIDYAGGNALAEWAWDTGLWNGLLRYRYNRGLRDFANQVIPRKDLRTRNAFVGQLGRRLGQNMGLTFRAEVADIFYTENRFLDQERILGGVAFDWYSRAGNSIGFDVELIDGAFDNNPLNDYTQIDAGPTMRWVISGKTRINAKVGYSSREHAQSPERDFDGFTGRVDVDWRTGGDSKALFSVFREISNLSDEIANFAIIHGVSIEPTWQISTRTALRLQLAYEDRDFQGDDGVIIPQPDDRRDKVASGGIWVEWTTEGAWTFSLGAYGEDRSSNRDFANYDFLAAEGFVRFGF